MRTSVATIFLLGLLASGLHAQTQTWSARLAPVPRTAATVTTITGSGSVTAVLEGTTLTVTGTFTGLQSPATGARLHLSERTGVRGQAIFDLQVAGGTEGTVSGTLQVSRVHVAGLERGQFYIQLQSQNAPEGNLWGWLLHPKAAR